MKKQIMEYETPALVEHQMFMEGVLCISGGTNESETSDLDGLLKPAIGICSNCGARVMLVGGPCSQCGVTPAAP